MAILDRFTTIFFSSKLGHARAIIYCVSLVVGAVKLCTAQILGDRFALGGRP